MELHSTSHLRFPNLQSLTSCYHLAVLVVDNKWIFNHFVLVNIWFNGTFSFVMLLWYLENNVNFPSFVYLPGCHSCGSCSWSSCLHLLLYIKDEIHQTLSLQSPHMADWICSISLCLAAVPCCVSLKWSGFMMRESARWWSGKNKSCEIYQTVILFMKQHKMFCQTFCRSGCMRAALLKRDSDH